MMMTDHMDINDFLDTYFEKKWSWSELTKHYDDMAKKVLIKKGVPFETMPGNKRVRKTPRVMLTLIKSGLYGGTRYYRMAPYKIVQTHFKSYTQPYLADRYDFEGKPCISKLPKYNEAVELVKCFLQWRETELVAQKREAKRKADHWKDKVINGNLADLSDIPALYVVDKLSINQIAKLKNMSASPIRNRLVKAGVKMRPVGKHKKSR